VWKALTDKDQMKQWYFDISSFRPEVGFEFSFVGGREEQSYKHLCRVTQAVPNKKLAYTWRYEGYEGDSEVTFELFAEGSSTRLKLTHQGLETFPQNNEDFARTSFTEGWTAITGTMLKNFLEGVKQ
nr:SRPBCC domain-containing protein [Chitinophagaceae bacterium]